MQRDTTIRLLVVDDEVTLRELIALYLREEGYEVLTAKDGLDALHLIEQQQPDAIVLDLMMPRLDGWGLMRELEVAGYSDIPIILCSANRLKEQTPHRSNVIGFLAKPFSFEQLDAYIGRVVQRQDGP